MNETEMCAPASISFSEASPAAAAAAEAAAYRDVTPASFSPSAVKHSDSGSMHIYVSVQ